MKKLLKNKNFLMVVVTVLLIAVVVIVVRRKKKAKESDSAGGGVSEKGGVLSSMPVASFPLTPYSQAGEYSAEAGSYGQQIAVLQEICNEKFGKNLDVDGKYGPKSESAFMSCFGSPFAPPYSEEVYNGFIFSHGKIK